MRIQIIIKYIVKTFDVSTLNGLNWLRLNPLSVYFEHGNELPKMGTDSHLLATESYIVTTSLRLNTSLWTYVAIAICSFD
jgi:hypothetical protein